MSYIVSVSTAVPRYRIEKEDMLRFYSKAVEASENERFVQRLNLIARKTKIEARYSCLPDFKGKEYELFKDENYEPPVEKRMEVYKQKILPLASDAINKIFAEGTVTPHEITHLITVSCTGLFAPGLEFMIAEEYGLQNVEKSAINFCGCYAAMKALKQAHYIAGSDPSACILIVCAELCSLHFYHSVKDEDVISNLLFADGAAAAIVCGEKNKHAENKVVLQIDNVGSACVPGTADLMKWDVGSTAFKMFLSPEVVGAIRENIHTAISGFLGGTEEETDYWAIHPGGARIVEAVKESLGLTEEQVADSMGVLRLFGNMSSPTILFVLDTIFKKIKGAGHINSKKITACAFGPGLTIEMIRLSSLDTTVISKYNHFTEAHATQV